MSFDVERAHCIRGCRGVTVTDSLPDREFAFSSADFEQVRSLLYRRVGISLSDAKESLVYGRLSRRLRDLAAEMFVLGVRLIRAGGELVHRLAAGR